MPGNSFIQVTLGVLVIGFLITYALAATHHAGKKSEKGMSAGLEIPQAIISIVVALDKLASAPGWYARVNAGRLALAPQRLLPT